MDLEEQLWDGAAEWLAAAQQERASGRLRVAFEAARHSAELSAKALLVRATGSFPKSHTVAGQLHRAGLVPAGVEPKVLHRLLSDFTLGTYGFERPLEDAEVANAIALARAMLSAR